MTDTVSEWFPEGALSLDRIGLALGECLGNWRDSWLARSSLRIGVKAPALMPAHIIESAAPLSGKHVALSLPATGKRYLLEHLLDEQLAGNDLNASDHRLLDDLAARATRDLVDRFDALFGTSFVQAGQTDHLGIVIESQEIYRFAYPRGGMIALVRRSISLSPRSQPPFMSRTRALAPCRTDIECVLGTVDLTVDDLQELERGDVLILDRKLDDPVPLQLRESGHVIGFGKPTSVDRRNAIGF